MKIVHWIATGSLILFLITGGACIALRKRAFNHPQHTIGLLYISSMVQHERMAQAVKKELQADAHFIIKEFPVSIAADPLLTGPACRATLTSAVDLLVAVGTTCARSCAALAKKGASSKPVVFVTTDDPVGAGIVPSIEKPGETITGVTSTTPQDAQAIAELLHTIKPSLKRTLIVYAALSGGTSTLARQLKNIWTRRAVKATLLPVLNTAETLPICAGMLQKKDALIYLEDDSLTTFAPGLGKLASQHGATMLAVAIDRAPGAAVSYTVELAPLAALATELTRAILCKRRPAGAHPVARATGNHALTFDQKLFKYQGLQNETAAGLTAKIKQNPSLDQLFSSISAV